MVKKMILPLLLTAQMWAAETKVWFNSGTPHTVYVKHKAAHALVGLTLTYLSHEAGDYIPGLIAAFILAVLKEDMDRRGGGKFRVGDIAWTVGPAIVVAVGFKW